MFSVSALLVSCSDDREADYNFESTPDELQAPLPASAGAPGEAEAGFAFGDGTLSLKSMGEAPAAVMMKEAPAASARQQETENTAERKKTYTGGCTIQSASAAETILEAGKIAENYGGWIESSSASHAAVRVPAANFRKAFNSLLQLGNVIDKYEEAADVTEQYTDLETRLGVLLGARKRLENLLFTVNETEKKVPILRELKRIDDQIERLKAELKTLDEAVSYAVIILNIVPYNYDNASVPAGMFPWIGHLDPFSVSIKQLFRKISVPLPEEFALLRGQGFRYFHAESSDGTVLRIGTIDNDPEGSSSFWQKAIAHGISSRFSDSEEGESGNMKYVVFKGKRSSTYSYIAGTIIRRKLLYVAEIYFPNPESYDKWKESLTESLGRMEIR